MESASMNIRRAKEADFESIWLIFRAMAADALWIASLFFWIPEA
jgi:hypothetical protein